MLSVAASEVEFDMDIDGEHIISSMAKSAMGLEAQQQVPDEQIGQFELIKGNISKGRKNLGKELGKSFTKAKVRRTIQ